MVQLTATLCKYVPWYMALPQRRRSFFKWESMRKMMWATSGRQRQVNKIMILRFFLKLKNIPKYREREQVFIDDLQQQRILAAVQEQDWDYTKFRAALHQMEIKLDNHSLSNLAVYEPRTFQALVDLARHKRFLDKDDEISHEDGPRPNILDRRML